MYRRVTGGDAARMQRPTAELGGFVRVLGGGGGGGQREGSATRLVVRVRRDVTARRAPEYSASRDKLPLGAVCHRFLAATARYSVSSAADFAAAAAGVE